jgi:hypothetical protein
MGNIFSFLEIQRNENINLKTLDKVFDTSERKDKENCIENGIEENDSDDELPPQAPKLKREESQIFKTPRNTDIISDINKNNISKFEQLPDCQGASSVYYGKKINENGENVYFLSYRAKVYDECPDTADKIIAHGGNNLKILKGPLDPDEYKPFNFTGQDFLDL